MQKVDPGGFLVPQARQMTDPSRAIWLRAGESGAGPTPGDLTGGTGGTAATGGTGGRGGTAGNAVVVSAVPGVGVPAVGVPDRKMVSISPKRTVFPSWRRVGAEIRSPLTNVPPVEPRSSTDTLPPLVRRTAWRRLT